MKTLTMLIVLSLFIAGAVSAASAAGVLDLSTLGKTTTTMEPVKLPRLTAYTPSITSYSDNLSPVVGVLDLSTLGKAVSRSTINARVLTGAKPITITPAIAIMNANVTSGANTVYTPAHALAGAQINNLIPNATIYTPPIAIFGGA